MSLFDSIKKHYNHGLFGFPGAHATPNSPPIALLVGAVSKGKDMKDQNIELPPEFCSGNSVPVERATIKRGRMEEILRAAIEADRKNTAELLKSPVHVHTNMCRGIIAPITFDQLAHVLGDEATKEWIADRQRRGEPVQELMEVLLFASYCDNSDSSCTNTKPCQACIGMSNVFLIPKGTELKYAREFAPDLNTAPQPTEPVVANAPVPSDDVLADALSNLEHDNYEQSYSGYKNRQADIALIRALLSRYSSGKPAASAEPNAHTDDDAVDHFAAAMKEKLAQARAKGRHGWHECAPADLSAMLRAHVEKGDPRDVANFCMFLWSLGQPISAAPVAQEPVGTAHEAGPMYVPGTTVAAFDAENVPAGTKLFSAPVAAQAQPTWGDLQSLAAKHGVWVPGYGPFAAELLATYGAAPTEQPHWVETWLSAMRSHEKNAAQAQAVVNKQLTTEPSDRDLEDDEALADTQRAIIEAAERRGYERAIAECAQDLEDAERYAYLRDTPRSERPESLRSAVDLQQNAILDREVDAARAAKGE